MKTPGQLASSAKHKVNSSRHRRPDRGSATLVTAVNPPSALDAATRTLDRSKAIDSTLPTTSIVPASKSPAFSVSKTHSTKSHADNIITTTIRPVERGDSDESLQTTSSSSSGSNNINNIAASPFDSPPLPAQGPRSPSGTTVTSQGSGRTQSSRKSRSSRSSDTGAVASPRIVYGPGTISRLPEELARLELRRPVLVSSPSRIPLARKIQSLIPNLDSRILDSAVVNVPTRVIDDAVDRISDRDCVISVGGDSAVGLGKAIGLRKRIPFICIPTTYSGAEPALLCKSHSGKKYGNRESKGLIAVVIYDEDLTMSPAERFSAPSGAYGKEVMRANRGKDEDTQWSYIHLPGV